MKHCPDCRIIFPEGDLCLFCGEDLEDNAPGGSLETAPNPEVDFDFECGIMHVGPIKISVKPGISLPRKLPRYRMGQIDGAEEN